MSLWGVGLVVGMFGDWRIGGIVGGFGEKTMGNWTPWGGVKRGVRTRMC